MLITCPNCLTVFVDVHELCPCCDADREGEGACLPIEGATRSAVYRLGGLHGGILEVGDGRSLLWCERGVCLHSDEIGHVWDRMLSGRADEVRFDETCVHVRVGAAQLSLELATGEPL